eukprot:CAMPEP_0170426490 /NCGR_PEP_ID=MMETSP0117_2-20130122/38687_1 /TAXON_ID=400756 /ORGANISM="Durinskia baltica, Strain CSIRO CS-38" /LENGTH=105 /DNA_ID=CAMNT_0010685565 /DNA_START=181 /DNA_END=495 /DNA_ORIENTATION=+
MEVMKTASTTKTASPMSGKENCSNCAAKMRWFSWTRLLFNCDVLCRRSGSSSVEDRGPAGSSAGWSGAPTTNEDRPRVSCRLGSTGSNDAIAAFRFQAACASQAE